MSGAVQERDLEGLLVVSVEQAVAAPLASRLLADAGARVIKVERPEGDFARSYDQMVRGESAHFVWLNRGKESIALDLKQRQDHELLLRILASADVFLTNLAPGPLERLGLAHKRLRRRFPSLVFCEISGYGREGPYRDMKAYDLLVQAETGVAYVTGIGDRPTRVGVSVCDIAAGLNAYAAILRALLARSRDGRGRVIEVSLFHSVGEWMNIPYLTYLFGGFEPPRLGLHHPGIAPYGAYRCGDGRSLLLAIQNDREWRRFCGQVLGREELADDPRFCTNPQRTAHREELDRLIEDRFAGHSRKEVARMLNAANIAWGCLSSLEDLARHPQNRHVPVRLEQGAIVELLAPGARFDTDAVVPAEIPRLDQHGPAIRAEFRGPGDGEGGGACV